jgi:predicted DNA-binding antitoxin AbrB/MazE fold protein
MTATFAAIYEKGVLRPIDPVDLEEGTHVEVMVVHAAPPPGGETAGRILAEIASLPVEGSGDPFTGRDHDKYLYGRRDTE